jgi:hypothetical protein
LLYNTQTHSSMKKTALLLLSMLALHAFPQAQKKEKSGSFDIPDGHPYKEYHAYVKELKNGNTFYMNITKKEGINVLLFDTTHKKIGSGKLDLKLVGDKIGYFEMEGVFEISGNVVFFLQLAEDRTPFLVRVIVDGKTGKLKSEEKVGEMEKIKAGAGYAMFFADVDIPDFTVEKDPNSDYYAIITYNTFAKETKNRIEVTHCGPDHKVINKAFYAPNDHFKYTRFFSAYVKDKDYVLLGVYAFNTDKTGGDEGRVYLAQLPKGSLAFKQQELAYRNFYKKVSGHFVYNKPKEMIHLYLVTDVEYTRNKKIYETHLQNINPTTLKVDKEYAPDFSQVNTYYEEKMENKDDFNGILRDMTIDRSGNLILFYQQKTIVTGKNSVKIFYGDVALLTVTPAGKTINSAVFPNDILGGTCVGAMDMVTTENNTYLLFHNTMENMNRPENKSAHTVRARGEAIPVKYTYGNGTVTKDYLFKKPKEEKGNAYCDFAISDYNPKTKKYSVIYFDPEKDKACLMYVGLN